MRTKYHLPLPVNHIIKCILAILMITGPFFLPSGSIAQAARETIQFEGRTRDYMIFLPSDYAVLDSLPLIMNFHGSNTGFDGAWQMGYSKMNAVADTAGFIVVYPTGILENGSLGGWFTDVADPVNGIGFIDALLDSLNELYRINNDQIYACGSSAGGSFSCKLAIELPDRFAAITSVSGGIGGGVMLNAELKRPMPFMSIHGTEDSYRSAEMTSEFWQDLNICSKADTVIIPDVNQGDSTTVEKMTYSNQGTGCKIVQIKVINGGHTWPGAAYDIPQVGYTNRDINAGSEIWNFFRQYRLSELSFPADDITPRSLVFGLKTLPKYMNLRPNVLMQNGGLNDASAVPAVFTIDSSGIVVYEDNRISDKFESMEKRELVFDKIRTLYGDRYDLTCITLFPEDDNKENDTLRCGITVTNGIDDFESGDMQWISEYGWGLRRSAVNATSGDYSLYSRQNKTYKDADTCTVTFFSSFNLSSLKTACLSYSAKYDFSPGDTGYAEISTNAGQSWTQAGDATTGIRDEFGISVIPLEDFTRPETGELMFRFKVINDPANGFPKWTIDDVMLHPNEATVTGVGKEYVRIGKEDFVLKNNYPNPFNQSTVIRYAITREQHLTIRILNILGQEVRTLIDQEQPPGEYTVIWNGRNSRGFEADSGIYYCRMQAADKIRTIKMLLLK
ncbi:T9SS type A sorting domain-containing protein [bacterium]|nr:T9SS type A sorting domain-containing protein [bacterium]